MSVRLMVKVIKVSGGEADRITQSAFVQLTITFAVM